MLDQASLSIYEFPAIKEFSILTSNELTFKLSLEIQNLLIIENYVFNSNEER